MTVSENLKALGSFPTTGIYSDNLFYNSGKTQQILAWGGMKGRVRDQVQCSTAELHPQLQLTAVFIS